jgi:hypothetical protein
MAGGKSCLAWTFHELEAFIGQAFKGAAVLSYRKPLITKSPARPQGENFLAAFEGCRGNKLCPSPIPPNPVPLEDIMIFFMFAKKFS